MFFVFFFKNQSNKQTNTHIKIVMRVNNNVSISVFTDYTLGEKAKEETESLKNHLQGNKNKENEQTKRGKEK